MNIFMETDSRPSYQNPGAAAVIPFFKAGLASQILLRGSTSKAPPDHQRSTLSHTGIWTESFSSNDSSSPPTLALVTVLGIRKSFVNQAQYKPDD